MDSPAGLQKRRQWFLWDACSKLGFCDALATQAALVREPLAAIEFVNRVIEIEGLDPEGSVHFRPLMEVYRKHVEP